MCEDFVEGLLVQCDIY